MTMTIAIQILLTLFITGACTLFVFENVTVDEKYTKLDNSFKWVSRVLILLHAVLIPAAIINLIWSW
jgi:hypothetical protein